MTFLELIEEIIYEKKYRKGDFNYILKNPSYKEIEDIFERYYFKFFESRRINKGNNYLRFAYDPKNNDIYMGHAKYYVHYDFSNRLYRDLEEFVTGFIYYNKKFVIDKTSKENKEKVVRKIKRTQNEIN